MFDRRRAEPAPTVRVRGAWGMTAALLLEVAASTIPIVGLLEGAAWWWALMGVTALLLIVPAALRSAGIVAWLASVIDLAALVALVGAVYVPRQSALGFVPTPSSVAAVRWIFDDAFLAIQQQGVPAQPLPELIFLFVVFGGVFAIVLDLLAVTLRVPAVTALALAPVLVVAAVLQPDGVSLLALVACAVAWLLVLLADGRLRFGARGSGRLALMVGASATVIAVVVAGTAPGFVQVGRSITSGPVSIGSSVNPLIDLGRDLRRPEVTKVLEYTTTSTTPTYLQLTTLDEFSGTVWRHSSSTVRALGDGTVGDDPPGLDTALGVPSTTVATRVKIESMVSRWYPAPYPTTKITGADGADTVQADDLTISGPGSNLAGARYTTTSVDLEPTADQLSSVQADPSQFPRAIRDEMYLPAQVPAIVSETARSIAKNADGTGEFAYALALQDYFQDSRNGFSYSTSTPDSTEGSSLAVVAKFLRVKEGYCVHFATAMALMARVLGIPSRIAIGYQPGTAVSVDGERVTYEVNSDDLHAWPQLYFSGIGWLSFEPTVSRGAAPAYTTMETATTAPSAVPSSTPSPTATASASAERTALPEEQQPDASDTAADGNPAPLVLGLLILLAVLVAPMITRRSLRSSRLHRIRRDGGPPSLAWTEVRDTAHDLGLTMAPTQTPRAFVARLQDAGHLDAAQQAALDRILELVERSQYGPPASWPRVTELADATHAVISALERGRPRGARLFALLVPRSLFAPSAERGRASAHNVP